MAISKSRTNSGYFIKANVSGLKEIHKITEELKKNVDKYGNRLLEKVCQIFIERAKSKLALSGYNVGRLLDNIYYQPYGKNKYRVGIKNNKDKPIMYFLEFGTGFVGDGTMSDPKGNKGTAHPDADKVGWEYASGDVMWRQLNSHENYEREGWWYPDIDGEIRFTSGLRSIAYIYDTLQEMDDIIKQAKREVRFND